jgi:hypothetical protein
MWLVFSYLEWSAEKWSDEISAHAEASASRTGRLHHREQFEYCGVY